MLRKLLKYDFLSVIKFWCIAAITSLGLGLLAGGCINVFNSDRHLPMIVDTSAVILFVIALIGIVAFSFLSMILVYVRFYKNLFTDEGYLTFTLPVKISQILNSKIILGWVMSVAALIVTFIDLVVMLAIGIPDEIFNIENYRNLIEILKIVVEKIGWYLIVYILEGIVLFGLFILFAQLFLNACITFAALITKKARVITAIGIYYVANGIFSFVLEMIIIFAAPSLIEKMVGLTENTLHIAFIISLLCAVVFCFMGCMLLYALQYWMLDRKLNLS